MPATADMYATGYDAGRAQGDADLAQGLGITHDQLAEGRDAVAAVVSRPGRAYYLGWLRGYRAAVRTFKWGKWGD